MKLIQVNGVPHWTDGFLTLPVMAGGDHGPYHLPGEDDEPTGGGGTTGGTTGGTLPKDRVVRNWGQFQSLIPDYEGRSMADILRSPLFNGQGAYIFDPNFFKQLQDTMMQLEAGYGVVPSQQPAGILGGKTNLKNALESAASGGGSGGGGGGGGSAYQAQPYGYSAPDPQAAINSMMDYYDRQVQAGLMPRETAMQQFEADLSTFNSNLDRAIAANNDIREREISEANRRQNLTSEATSRAGTVARDILPRITPGNAASYNVPLLGNVQSNPVNVPELFNQGLPDLATQWANGISQTPGDYGGMMTAPQLPQPVMPQLPDIQALLGQLQSGSGPMGWA